MKAKHTKISKFLSYVLRHRPDSINISLDTEGWVNIDELLKQAQQHGKAITHSLLKEIVQTNDKQRFIISEDGTRIRANQGHSIPVDLKLQPKNPPAYLYHGTAQKYLDSIMTQGLKKRNRQHVHLSFEKETAIKVGSRHGKVVILKIAAQDMQRAGHSFYRSENNVWLTDHVPVEFLTRDG